MTRLRLSGHPRRRRRRRPGAGAAAGSGRCPRHPRRRADRGNLRRTRCRDRHVAAESGRAPRGPADLPAVLGADTRGAPRQADALLLGHADARSRLDCRRSGARQPGASHQQPRVLVPGLFGDAGRPGARRCDQEQRADPQPVSRRSWSSSSNREDCRRNRSRCSRRGMCTAPSSSTREGSLTVNAGFSAFATPNEEVRRQSALQFETPTPWNEVRHDAYTFRFAMDHLARHQPRVLYLGARRDRRLGARRPLRSRARGAGAQRPVPRAALDVAAVAARLSRHDAHPDHDGPRPRPYAGGLEGPRQRCRRARAKRGWRSCRRR